MKSHNSVNIESLGTITSKTEISLSEKIHYALISNSFIKDTGILCTFL